MFNFYDDRSTLYLDCAKRSSCKSLQEMKPLSYAKKILVDKNLNFLHIDDNFELKRLHVKHDIIGVGGNLFTFPELECLCLLYGEDIQIYALIDNTLKYIRSINCGWAKFSKNYIVASSYCAAGYIITDKCINPLTGYTTKFTGLSKEYTLNNDIIVFCKDKNLQFYKLPSFNYLYEMKCKDNVLRLISCGEKYFSIVYRNILNEYYEFNENLTCRPCQLPKIDVSNARYIFSMPYPKELIHALKELLIARLNPVLVEHILLPYLFD